MPFFSVIIPTLNADKTLAVALESIMEQTYTDFEILIMDGLSTDKTLEITKSYNDNRIRVYSEIDRGIYDAMNKGIKLAQGEWIYFLGSDDSLYSNAIFQKIVNKTIENNCDIIYGDVYSTRFNGRYAGEFNCIKILSQNICHQSIFFKKMIFNTIGSFNLEYKSHADWDHNMHWFLSSKISKIYLNIIIAEYADGGFSSINSDIKFANEKQLNFLLYGKTQINLRLRINILLNELKRTCSFQNFRLFLKLIINTPKIIAGV